MSLPVRIDEGLYESAKLAAKSVGRAALDNPDLPVDFVVDLLRARKEPRENLIPFVPGQYRG